MGNGNGHVEFNCVVRDLASIGNTAETGNTLECVLATDQTFTWSTLADLFAALKEFLIVGKVETAIGTTSGGEP